MRGGVRLVFSFAEHVLVMWDLFPPSLVKSSRNFHGAHWVKNGNVGWIKCVCISAWVLGQDELRVWIQSYSWKYSLSE